jgi:hypothetical protein
MSEQDYFLAPKQRKKPIICDKRSLDVVSGIAQVIKTLIISLEPKRLERLNITERQLIDV